MPQPAEEIDNENSAESRLPRYRDSTATCAETKGDVVEVVSVRIERNHPAESQEHGIKNSDQPQSRQTVISGDGVMGGWLRVRWLLR
jgi:hypothetical protein